MIKTTERTRVLLTWLAVVAFFGILAAYGIASLRIHQSPDPECEPIGAGVCRLFVRDTGHVCFMRQWARGIDCETMDPARMP